MTPAELAAIRQVDALCDELVGFTQALVRVPSVNPPGDRYAECADLIATQLRKFGYTVEHFAPTNQPDRVNVVGTLGQGRTVLHFNGHYDVVPAENGWTVDPFSAILRDGRIYGRGTCDQKAGISAS
ncbi:MAG: M20/M25/M40 family metallo-hydrolase, partial [Chloroflexi bacterium]|nr:M20/M25/M40 family metallo-hydrolase [Chloroflexota bacterium]